MPESTNLNPKNIENDANISSDVNTKLFQLDHLLRLFIN